MLRHMAHSYWLHFWMRALLCLPCIFPPIYNAHPSPHSPISTLLIVRERELVAFALVSFVDSSFIANAVTFKATPSSKAHSPVSSFSFFLHIFGLVEQFLNEDVNLGT